MQKNIVKATSYELKTNNLNFSETECILNKNYYLCMEKIRLTMRFKLSLLLSALSLPLLAKDAVITVNNNDSVIRHELVEIDAEKVYRTMDIPKGESLIILNTARQQVSYQTTYDGKILIDVTLRPKSKATFTAKKGKPAEMKHYVHGAMYKIRKDDIAWENDRGAYRVYGPALQRTGEKSFGTDIWVKNTPELVVENRYTKDHEGNILGNKLSKEGKKKEADSVDVATSFHLDHGDGMDAYAVGATLGCGAPAIMDEGHLVYPYCYKDYKILDNGPLRFTVQLDYNPTAIGNDKDVTEHRIISLDKGSNFNKMTVWYTNLSSPRNFASGVVLHGQENRVVLGKNFVEYADPTDNPKLNNCELYVACLFPHNKVTTSIQKKNKEKGINASHALGIYKGLKGNQKITYYFGSAWSQYDVRSQKEWHERINSYCMALKTPISVEIKAKEEK